jgi:hypothetical protein
VTVTGVIAPTTGERYVVIENGTRKIPGNLIAAELPGAQVQRDSSLPTEKHLPLSTIWTMAWLGRWR